MAAEWQPGVVTFRPDNFLTVGLIGATMYVAAVVIVQGLMRAGLIGSSSPAPAATPRVASA